MTCIHLSTSDDAVAIEPDGTQTRCIAYLCDWADAHPERFANAPRWITQYALSGGGLFTPQKHCTGCPGRHERLPQHADE